MAENQWVFPGVKFHPTYRGYFTPFIADFWAHLVNNQGSKRLHAGRCDEWIPKVASHIPGAGFLPIDIITKLVNKATNI